VHVEPIGIVLTALVAAGLAAVVASVVAVRLSARATGAVAHDGPDLQRAVDTLVAVAGEQLESRAREGASHLDARKELIDAELARMATTLEQVTGLVQRAESARASQLGQVSEQLQGVARQHVELSRTAGALREALTSSQARGQWGERMAGDVLRAAGFVEGVNYRTQVTTRSGTRPDVTFLLPGDQVVHMDVKFPLGRYLDMLAADTEVEREAARRDFLRAVRDRVKEIGARGYIDPQDGTLDCVLLFIPNEQVYGFVHEHDPTVLDDALSRKVVLCSPSTLFAVLAVIRQSVDAFALERTSGEILQLLVGFTDQWERFVDGMDTVGRRLESTQKAYDALASTRRNQLERQLSRIEELRSQEGVEAVLASDASARLVALPRGGGRQLGVDLAPGAAGGDVGSA
jgi:DNA recombination protein RmuC